VEKKCGRQYALQDNATIKGKMKNFIAQLSTENASIKLATAPNPSVT
jgi:hypothetical protein